MRPQVLIASPRYSQEVMAEASASRRLAEDNASYSARWHVDVPYHLDCHGSLLCWTFNSALAEALNQRDAGVVTHFAMAHSDVCAERGWLNELYMRMSERGDVLISAVVPIKEHERNRTSTAIGVRGDEFEVRRHIRVDERRELPRTFSTADVATSPDEVLLINTGLFLADLRHPFWDDFHFQINDVIKTNPETGRRQAYVSSEDWNMSRALDAAGVPYSATWMTLKHIGITHWDAIVEENDGDE